MGGLSLLTLAGCEVRHISQMVHPGATLSAGPGVGASPTPVKEMPATLAFTGDVMFGRTVNTHMLGTEANDLYPFTYTADFLRRFDLTIGNLECVISRIGSPVDKPPGFLLRGDPRAYERLVAAGFDLVSVANNHSGDYGKAAFIDELNALPAYGLTSLGGGKNKRQAHEAVFKTVRGTTIAFLAYDEIMPYSFAATETMPGHAWLNEDDLRFDLARTRPFADFVIAFVHWGTEYFTGMNEHQRYLARVAIDSGADLVVGAHPHVIEPYEFYKGKLIVYSLGNFVFDYMDAEVVRRGHMLTLAIQKDRLVEWRLVDTHIGDWGEPRLV